jgi:hypothetical protein
MKQAQTTFVLQPAAPCYHATKVPSPPCYLRSFSIYNDEIPMLLILSGAEIFHLQVKIPMSFLGICDKANSTVSVAVYETKLVLA